MEDNRRRLEEINEKLDRVHGDRLETKLRLIGWVILLFTVVSIVLLALVSGYVSYKELAEGEGGMPGGIPLSLEYALSLFIATLISLFVIFLITAIYFWRPMKQHLQVRKQNIETNIDAASYTRKAAEANWLESKEAKINAKSEASKLLAEIKLKADKERRETLEQTKREQDLLIEKTREQIEKEKEQLKDDIRNEILSTSLLAAEKIIEKELDANTNQKMIDELINSLK